MSAVSHEEPGGLEHGGGWGGTVARGSMKTRHLCAGLLAPTAGPLKPQRLVGMHLTLLLPPSLRPPRPSRTPRSVELLSNEMQRNATVGWGQAAKADLPSLELPVNEGRLCHVGVSVNGQNGTCGASRYCPKGCGGRGVGSGGRGGKGRAGAWEERATDCPLPLGGVPQASKASQGSQPQVSAEPPPPLLAMTRAPLPWLTALCCRLPGSSSLGLNLQGPPGPRGPKGDKGQ